MEFTASDYSELFAFYLGDGSISRHARTSRLRIALDTRYPDIVEACQRMLGRCFPENPVGLVEAHGGSMVFVSLYSAHLACLFPQHAPGMKHQRRIVLEDWQQRIVEAEPWAFIRGCIRTDGCSFINCTGPYEYLSYDFTNMSPEIVDLFVDACDRVGVRNRRTCWRGIHRVRINRGPSVARMLEHVGLKS